MGLHCCVPPGSSGGKLFPCFFQLREPDYILWLASSFSTFKSSSTASSLLSDLCFLSPSLFLFCFSFPYKDPCDYIRPTWLNQANLPISRPLIKFAKFILPCKVTHSQILGIRTSQTSVVDHYSVYQGQYLNSELFVEKEKKKKKQL